VSRPALALTLAAAFAAGLPAAVAQAAPTRSCASSDLRYRFRPGLPKDFGVFRLRIEGGRCATAHRVAAAWMDRFEANLRDGRVKLPRQVAGFRFRTLPPHAAQTYTERGRRGATTVRFDYRVPNG
jgi:hypothetical protein